MLAAVRAPELPNPGLAAPRDQQIQLGQKAVAEVYKQMPVLPDSSPVARYVQSLGHKLERVIPQEYNWPYQFHVIEEKDINAFALPGGPIFVNVGTVLAAENEAELAGVMAHEMAHVYMQHSIKGMRKQGTTQALGQILGGILGSVLGGTAGALANLGAQVGAGVISMRYSREDEAQADAVGAIIMYKANYNPLHMAQFFQKLEKEAGAGGPQFLSDHPNPGNRYEAVKEEIQNWPSRNFDNNSGEFAQAKEKARSVPAYTAQQIQDMAKSGRIHNTSAPAGVQSSPSAGAGTVENVPTDEVLPSGNWQAYQGAFFTIDHPTNWQPVQGQQNSGTVVIAPQAGLSQSGIAYGTLISAFQPQGANSMDAAMQELLTSLQQQNPGLRAAGRAQQIRVNGLLGRSVDLLGNSPVAGSKSQALPERDWLVALPGPNDGLVYVVFVAPEKDFSRLRPSFEQMLRSFHLTQ